MSTMIDRITSLARLLDDRLKERLWDYTELLYIEQVAYDALELPDGLDGGTQLCLQLEKERAAGSKRPYRRT